MLTFLYLFAFASANALEKPVLLYAGYEPGDQFAAYKQASLSPWDHFVFGTSAGSEVRAPHSFTPQERAEFSECVIAAAEAAARAAATEDTEELLSITERAYTAYCEAVGGKAFNGDPLPSWKEFAADPAKQLQANAWVQALAAATDQPAVPLPEPDPAKETPPVLTLPPNGGPAKKAK